LSLTSQEDEQLKAVEPAVCPKRLRNGLAVAELPAYEGRRNEVLFFSRLQARKRPDVFVQVAAILADRFPGVCFPLVGPDEGEARRVLAEIAELGLGGRVGLEGAIAPESSQGRIAMAKVLLLPAVNEVFPMVMLEAFAAGTPVVATPSLGIAEECLRYEAALLPGEDPAALADAVASVLEDEHLADRLRRGARRYLEADLSIGRVVDELVGEYERSAARA